MFKLITKVIFTFYCSKGSLNWTYVSKVSVSILTAHGRVVQSVTCLATDACLIADPGVTSLIPAQPILLWRLIIK